MTIWSGIGMNYGHQIYNTYNTAQVDSDFTYLKANGVNKIRIAFPGYSDTTMISYCQDMVKRALAKGFYVVWGVSTGVGSGLTATSWNAYKASVLNSLVPWAKSNNLSELCAGNECDIQADGTTLTAATVRSDILSLASSVKGKGFKGKVSFSTAAFSTSITSWIAEGLGSLDYIGWNSYDNLANFDIRNHTIVSAFGNNTYISEFGSITNGYPDFNNENLFYIDTWGRILLMQSAGISSGYFFCYRDGGRFGVEADTFGLMKTDGTSHLALQAVLGIPLVAK
jgi:hypothetical protein